MGEMRRWSRQVIIGIVAILAMPGFANAQLQTSTSYSMNESQVGGNGLFDAASNSYSITPNIDDGGASLGAATVGDSSSAHYSTSSGFDTTAQPGLSLIVNSGTVSMGTLTTASVTTATDGFSVKDYTSSGYMVTMVGTTLTNGTSTITSLGSDASSSPGTSQFGVNTVYDGNVDGAGHPLSGSANPVENPSASFSFGVAGNYTLGALGTRPYTIPNEFRFNSGDVVASSAQTSGETDYTMSFIANISTVTRGGKYQSNMTLIATGTY